MAIGKAVGAVGFALLIVVASSGAVHSAPGGVPADLESLANRLADPKTQAQALQSLGENADPTVEPIVRALKDGALYRLQGRLVILADDGSLRDVAGQTVDGTLPSGQEAAGLDEKLFGAVQRVLERFEVLSGSREVRRAAAIKLGNSGTPTAIPLLERAREREQDAAMRAVIDEALAKLKLASPDPAVRTRAVNYLGGLKSEASLSQLRAMLTSEPDPAVRQDIKAAVEGIESHIGIRNLVGYAFNGVSLGAVLLIMSLGLSVTFGLMGIINMAHGEMLMIGSYTAYVVQEIVARHWGAYQDYYFFVALPLSFIVAGLVGLALELGIIRFLYGRPLETLIVTWGIGMILQQCARLYFGDQTSVNAPTWFRGGVEAMTGLIFPWSRIFIVALAVASLLALWLVLNYTFAGLRVLLEGSPLKVCVSRARR